MVDENNNKNESSEPTHSDDMKTLTRLLAALNRFRQYDHRMQVSTVMTLLEVALADEAGRDLHPKDIERRIGLHTGTTSRNIWYWSEGTQGMTGAHKLIDIVPSSTDRRQKFLKMNSRGRAFVDSVIGDMDGKT